MNVQSTTADRSSSLPVLDAVSVENLTPDERAARRSALEAELRQLETFEQHDMGLRAEKCLAELTVLARRRLRTSDENLWSELIPPLRTLLPHVITCQMDLKEIIDEVRARGFGPHKSVSSIKNAVSTELAKLKKAGTLHQPVDENGVERRGVYGPADQSEIETHV